MKIKVTSVYVDDQEKALGFYTGVLGFVKKSDFSNGPYRWLTVASSEEPEGTELQLALNSNPAAKTFQQALFQQNQPAASLSGLASRRQGRHCASRARAISPARSSTFRCFETAGIDISKGLASSVTDVSPCASRASMARRVGSARAAKVEVSWSCICEKPIG